MFHALASSIGHSLAERLTLLANHVLAAEPVATRKLAAHSGRCLRVELEGRPTWLAALPDPAFRVTPAGLLEWCGADAPQTSDLHLRVAASNPALLLAQVATGELPKVEVQGDAQFAADLSWLMDNLRWDVQDDLERLIGRAPAFEVARIGRVLASGLRQALRALSDRHAGSPNAAQEAASGPR